MWPLGYGLARTGDDQIWDNGPALGFDNADLTDATPTLIYRTPDTGGNLFPLFPLTIYQSDTSSGFYRVFGEIDGAFWFSDAGEAIGSEDRFTQAGERYTIFQSGTRVESHSFFCLRED
jgi:hypothetical protein